MTSTPDDAVGRGVSIPFQTPPPVSDEYVMVSVSNAVSPSSFSLQLIGAETTAELDDLMTLMQSVPFGDFWCICRFLC